MVNIKDNGINLHKNNFIFSQTDLKIYKQENYSKYKKLVIINNKYSGLCEIICNYVLANDLLGKSKEENLLEKKITLENLSKNNFSKTHILKVYSVFRKIIALIFEIYPDNILSISDQWKLVEKNTQGSRRVNRTLLKKIINKTEDGKLLKLESFRKNNLLGFSGHSMLVKKISSNEFIFFDPNGGEKRNISFDRLNEEIDEQLRGSTDIYFLEGSKYLNRIKRFIAI